MTLSIFPPFRPRVPWFGPHLQTVRNYLRRDPPSLAAFPQELRRFPMADGDVLLGTLNRPLEATSRPAVLLLHGISGSQDSHYIRATANHLLRAGFPVLRLNLRGSGPSGPYCRASYHAGRTEDLHAAILQLDQALVRHGLVAIGVSLGGNLLLKYLGEQERRGFLAAAVAVSTPMIPKQAQTQIMKRRNTLYHKYILDGLKEESDRPNADLTPAQRAALPKIASVYEFDERIVAPANGFAGADDYYARTASYPLLAQIRVPTLLIHALDDPWVPPEPYLDFDWSKNPKLMPLLSPKGGHVGFHGAGDTTPWHDRCIVRFLDELGRPDRRWSA